MLSDVCLSVWRLSFAYIGPKSRTERPRKTKTGTEVAHVTRDSDTTFKVKRSKVILQGRGHILGCGLLHSLSCRLYDLYNANEVLSACVGMPRRRKKQNTQNFSLVVSQQRYGRDLIVSRIKPALCPKSLYSAKKLHDYSVFLFFYEMYYLVDASMTFLSDAV